MTEVGTQHRPSRDGRGLRATPESATLAINRVAAQRRAAGLPLIHLGFGEAGLPVAPALVERLRAAAAANDYRPSAGGRPFRDAAAGYFTRRGLSTEADQVVAGPGSKALLYALLVALPGDVVIPRPSWVSYAAQAALTDKRCTMADIGAAGGVPDPEELLRVIKDLRDAGGNPRILILTLPDNPTGTVAAREVVAAICDIARRHDLVVISDEIYRDLADVPVTSPAEFLPERTIVTGGLSKSLAAGGWRVGFCRCPAGDWGADLARSVTGIASEIWSSLAAPMEDAAVWALSDPPELVERVAQSRRLHRAVATAVHSVLSDAGVACRAPEAAFYLYPDFSPHRALLAEHDIASDVELAARLLDIGVATLPGSAFGDHASSLRLRLATSLLYGTTDVERESALVADDPAATPAVARALADLRRSLSALLAT